MSKVIKDMLSPTVLISYLNSKGGSCENHESTEPGPRVRLAQHRGFWSQPTGQQDHTPLSLQETALLRLEQMTK